MKKVMIAMPIYGNIPPKTHVSVINLLFHHIEGVELHYCYEVDSMTYTARNDLSQRAINGGYDYVLWIDADMVFPADALERMLKHDVDIVTGLYFQRRGDHAPVVYRFDFKKQVFKPFLPEKDTVTRCDACGFGLVLVKTSVLQDVINCYGGLLFHPKDTMGEDLSFCFRARMIEKEIWCDSNIKCGHIGEYVFTQDDYIPL